MNIKKTYLISSILLLVVLLSGSILIDSCKNKGNTSYNFTGDTILDGKNLVQINCTKCHALVPVNALTKDVWRYHALRSMSHYLGITAYMDGYYKKDSVAGVSMQEWETIQAYYRKLAPDNLDTAKPPIPLVNDWAGFTLKMPAPQANPAYTSMVAFNQLNHKIYTSDYVASNLTEYDSNLKQQAATVLPSSAVSAIFRKDASGNQAITSNIGRLDPIDFPNGKVINVNLDAKTGKENQTVIASELARPVQTIEGDFNKDGLTDLVILAQGHLKGGVYLFTQKADKTYVQSNISDKAGAVQAVVGDFNNDGWPDLMVLFGSVDEGLWMFLNDHKGGFSPKNLLRFPPVYGSSSFQLADIDHDGKPDLIYTCGYNFHDSRILKPYHGLYIFKNMGDWKFKQQWFYPINGCTKAIAADFDGDGDLDIATIAFFADFKNKPSEGFIYFKQDKLFSFTPHAIPISKYGRWMSMDVDDYNGDGKPDIILGNYSRGFKNQNDLQPFWQENIPFVVLENNTRK
ncbi:VCBS repeat protein [Mucilaginibacter frigoritolerans]|uniref:VCBS repeat protein n=1 Tax=Mucilaginibacter frigoritolerans TaxID=652788 RepID=A0A562TQM9_9SPHI|nr:VCBS repeat-containing protein [Mucilaginibacter frigoritolerans]TWI95901.1 VCBS repeat protein [Mucilaginibacter frigoritolerans]